MIFLLFCDISKPDLIFITLGGLIITIITLGLLLGFTTDGKEYIKHVEGVCGRELIAEDMCNIIIAKLK